MATETQHDPENYTGDRRIPAPTGGVETLAAAQAAWHLPRANWHCSGIGHATRHRRMAAVARKVSRPGQPAKDSGSRRSVGEVDPRGWTDRETKGGQNEWSHPARNKKSHHLMEFTGCPREGVIHVQFKRSEANQEN